MKDKYKEIEDLLERFFEGGTSNMEEEQLYRFFAGRDIPEHLLRYKPVFSYFETGVKDEFVEKVVPVRRLQRSKWFILGGIAAALLALILLNLFYTQKPFNPYEGSYIVRNGVRITDPEIIRPELEATIRRVLQQEEKMKNLAADLQEKGEYPLFIEEQLQLQKDEIMNRFQDEYIRNQVREILEKN